MKQLSLFVKIVPFCLQENQLFVLLNNNELLKDTITQQIPLDEIAQQIFTTKTKLIYAHAYLEQLYTHMEDDGISVVYFLLLPDQPTSLPKDFSWNQVKNLSVNKTDSSILDYALQRLQWKIEYTNVVYSLLPETFTLSELQDVYATILGEQLDKRNFRKKNVITSKFYIKERNTF